MAKTKIFFIKNKETNEKILFSEWLLAQKDEYGFTWKEIDELTGVSGVAAYGTKNTLGHPNNPPSGKFKKIVSGLDSNIENFQFETLFNERSDLSEEDYRMVGDKAIEMGFLVIRSPLIKELLGDQAYCAYAKGPKKMQNFIESLRKVDSQKYGHLRYFPQKQFKGKSKNLQDREKEIVSKVMAEMIIPEDSWEYLPRGIYDQVKDRLAIEGFERSTYSVKYHVRKICGREKTKKRYDLATQHFSRGDLTSLVDSFED